MTNTTQYTMTGEHNLAVNNSFTSSIACILYVILNIFNFEKYIQITFV